MKGKRKCHQNGFSTNNGYLLAAKEKTRATKAKVTQSVMQGKQITPAKKGVDNGENTLANKLKTKVVNLSEEKARKSESKKIDKQ